MIERAIPVLPVDDLATVKGFYIEGLGFRELFEARYGTEGTILGVERGGLRLHLDCPMPGHGRDACVVLEVPDADALYELWRASVLVKRPPKDEEWGARTFDLVDPAGNTLFVVGPLRPQP